MFGAELSSHCTAVQIPDVPTLAEALEADGVSVLAETGVTANGTIVDSAPLRAARQATTAIMCAAPLP